MLLKLQTQCSSTSVCVIVGWSFSALHLPIAQGASVSVCIMLTGFIFLFFGHHHQTVVLCSLLFNKWLSFMLKTVQFVFSLLKNDPGFTHKCLFKAPKKKKKIIKSEVKMIFPNSQTVFNIKYILQSHLEICENHWTQNRIHCQQHRLNTTNKSSSSTLQLLKK